MAIDAPMEERIDRNGAASGSPRSAAVDWERMHRRWGGTALVAISTGMIATAAWLKAYRQAGFSFLTDYMSDLGATAGWTGHVFNAALLFLGPMRFLFIAALLCDLHRRGMGAWMTSALACLALVLSAASGGTGMVPYSLHVTTHYVLAAVTYGGWTILAVWIAAFTLRRGETPALSILGFVSAAFALTFLVLYFLVPGKTLAISGEDALWEWLAFGTLQLWILGHSWRFSTATDHAELRDGRNAA